MRKKIKNNRLLIVFVALLALVVILFTQKNGQKERSFDKQLLKFNAEEITQIKLYPKSLTGGMIEINNADDQWTIKSGSETYKANKGMIDGMVSQLQNLTAISMVANSKDRWATYEVNDSLASNVELYAGKKKVADIYIGKFKFSQPQNMATYVRIAGKKETYKVEGFLSSTFNRQVNDLRDKTVINDQLANWSKLTFNYPADSSFVVSKENEKWMVDGMPADSAAVVKYINAIKRSNANKITESNTLISPNLYQLTIERDNLSPIVIDVKDEAMKQILHSSENSETWFDDQSLIDRLFVPKSKFSVNN